jgi:uncharacterized membrane protein YkvA (DUF1232 family)
MLTFDIKIKNVTLVFAVVLKKKKKKKHLKDNKKLLKNYRCNSKNKALRLKMMMNEIITYILYPKCKFFYRKFFC